MLDNTYRVIESHDQQSAVMYNVSTGVAFGPVINCFGIFTAEQVAEQFQLWLRDKHNIYHMDLTSPLWLCDYYVEFIDGLRTVITDNPAPAKMLTVWSS